METYTYMSMDMEEKKFRRSPSNRYLYIILVVGCIVSCVIGILIGRFAIRPDDEPEVKDGLYLKGVSEFLVKDGDPEIAEVLMKNINSDNIRKYLRKLTEKPHLAGTNESHELARELRDHWEAVGLDHVTMTPYKVLLSYPDPDDPNFVELLDENNVTQYRSNTTEKILTPEEDKPGVVPPFNAYSASGDIYGDIVYVNYGRVEDYQFLENNKSINVSGKIVFARYGEIYRGDKVRLAERWGAAGVILFSDPNDVTNGNFNRVYPDDWWLPPSGTERGTLLIGEGDPTTADYPSIETAYRELSTDYFVPKIPCHPIGYGIAMDLMKNLGGDSVQDEWQGGMNVTYRFGDEFIVPGWKAHIKISTSNQNATTYNTIGVIRGSVEPDRYVIIGNHRDAWVFGAIDPSSGTAVMMEISRVMGQLVKSGKWRPRRSIVFGSWGAEEYGIIGVTEWVEEYTKSLGARAVAYVNVDYAFDGNFSFYAEGTPLLFSPVIKATKSIRNPNETEIAAGRTTVYDTWLATFPAKKFGRPRIALPGSGSDYAPFRDKLGVPIIDLWYTYDPDLNVLSYPLYHSVYDTFYMVDKIADIGFKYHTTMGQIWTEVTRDLADSLLLPFNVSDYSSVLNDLGESFISRFEREMQSFGLDTSLLQGVISNFTRETEEFEKRIKTANLQDPFVVRRINDQLMQLDRAFLDPAGLPGRKLKRHILFADSTIDNYSGSSFPGLSDALVEISLGKNTTEQREIVKKHFSVVLFTIQSAAGTLKDVSDFMYRR